MWNRSQWNIGSKLPRKSHFWQPGPTCLALHTNKCPISSPNIAVGVCWELVPPRVSTKKLYAPTVHEATRRYTMMVSNIVLLSSTYVKLICNQDLIPATSVKQWLRKFQACKMSCHGGVQSTSRVGLTIQQFLFRFVWYWFGCLAARHATEETTVSIHRRRCLIDQCLHFKSNAVHFCKWCFISNSWFRPDDSIHPNHANQTGGDVAICNSKGRRWLGF